MSCIINNGGLNAGRKGTKIRDSLKILFLFFIITVVSPGCIESQKIPVPNETKITTPEPTPEQKLPAYDETKPLKVNVTFETWSRGYYSNESYRQKYFRVITNYNTWIAFLNEQGYFSKPARLEGTLFPGLGVKPKTIEPADFKENFIIAAMMGLKGFTEGPEIEIKDISRMNNTMNIKVWMYEPTFGAMAQSEPYHIVIVKREFLPKGNATFVFSDTKGKKLEDTIIPLEAPVGDVNNIQISANSIQAQLIQEKIKSKLIGFAITYSGKWGETEKYTINESDIKMMNETWLDSKRAWKVRIREAMTWDIYFDEKGENIVKVEQLFRT